MINAAPPLASVPAVTYSPPSGAYVGTPEARSRQAARAPYFLSPNYQPITLSPRALEATPADWSPPPATWQIQLGEAFSNLDPAVGEAIETAFRRGVPLHGMTIDAEVWLIDFPNRVARDGKGRDFPLRRLKDSHEAPSRGASSPLALGFSPYVGPNGHSPSASVARYGQRLSICSSNSSEATPEATPAHSPFNTPVHPGRPKGFRPFGEVELVEWYYTDADDVWAPYPASVSAAIEAAHAARSGAITVSNPEIGIHSVDTLGLVCWDASGRPGKLLRVQTGPAERCVKCLRRLKWRLKHVDGKEPEEFICGDCDQQCTKSIDGFVHCGRCEWFLCRTCEAEGEEFAKRRREERLRRRAERARRRELRELRRQQEAAAAAAAVQTVASSIQA